MNNKDTLVENMNQGFIEVSEEPRNVVSRKNRKKTIVRIKLISKSSLRKWLPVRIDAGKKVYKCNFKNIGEQIKILVEPNVDVRMKVGRIISREHLINTSKKATFIVKGPGYIFRVSVTPPE